MPTISTWGRQLTVCLLLILAGCGDSLAPVDNLPRQAVSGTVTLDGQPLAQGKIQFNPVTVADGPTAFAVVEIKDGKYAINRVMGPVPGKYKVSISTLTSIKITPGEGPGPLPKRDPEKVPAQYNTKTTLTAEITSGENILPFDLKSQ